jgi:hypothetical protein
VEVDGREVPDGVVVLADDNARHDVVVTMGARAAEPREHRARSVADSRAE